MEGKARLGPAIGRTLLKEMEILDHTAALLVRAPYPTLLLPSWGGPEEMQNSVTCLLRCLQNWIWRISIPKDCRSRTPSIACLFARNAPIKFTSIPRLELQAAVLATRLNKMLRKELDLPIQQTKYWTDSEIVLHYLKNEF